MTWRRWNSNAIQNDRGNVIVRLADGRFQLWSAPGDWSHLEKAVAQSVQRELAGLGFDAQSPFTPVTYRDAATVIGVYATADEARAAAKR